MIAGPRTYAIQIGPLRGFPALCAATGLIEQGFSLEKHPEIRV